MSENTRIIFSWILITTVTVGILLTIILIPVSIRDVNHDQYGIRYNDLDKTLDSKLYEQGKYVLTPQTKMFYYSKIVKTLTFEDMVCLSQDGIYITMNIDVQYLLIKESLFDIFWEYGKEDNLKELLIDLTHDSVRDVCGKYNATDFPDNRDGIQSDMQETLTQDFELTNTHSLVQYLQLVNYDFPDSLNDAIDAKQTAQQDIEKAENERNGALTTAETTQSVAEANAQVLLDQANGNAQIELTKAEEEKTSTEAVWQNRLDTYYTLMNDMGMTSDEFVDEYIYGILLNNGKVIYTDIN